MKSLHFKYAFGVTPIRQFSIFVQQKTQIQIQMQTIYQFEIRNTKNIQEISLFNGEMFRFLLHQTKKNKISFMDLG